jgi:hypothetical protein
VKQGLAARLGKDIRGNPEEKVAGMHLEYIDGTMNDAALAYSDAANKRTQR